MSPDSPMLVRARSPPPVADRLVDVRPGAVGTFDGDQLRLPLWVGDGSDREPVPWSDRVGLTAAVGRRLAHGGGTIRFGDRSACRSALGRSAAEAVERQLVAVARSRGAGLLTWTEVAPRDRDYRRYEVVIDTLG